MIVKIYSLESSERTMHILSPERQAKPFSVPVSTKREYS